ncbi:MAG: MFS transporter [Candidatus Limnocylindrales bacterium]
MVGKPFGGPDVALTEATADAATRAATVSGVLHNRRFLALWLAQLASQIGGNMVLFGLTVLVSAKTNSNSAVSLLILSFLVPAVVFSAIAGVYVDRLDRRTVLVVTNVARGIAVVAMVVVHDQVALIFVLTAAVSTLTVFFAPAEASMIPEILDRRQLLAANSLFTFTLQASFAVGFALFGPIVVGVSSVDALIILVAGLYLGAALLCLLLPAAPPPGKGVGAAGALGEGRRAVASTVGELRAGLAFIRANPTIFRSLSYLAITASLIGVLGALGPGFARSSLGLTDEGLAVVLLPLGAGLVIGILMLNAYGRNFARRRVIESGMITLAVSLGLLALSRPISAFLKGTTDGTGVTGLVSLLGIVVMLALIAGVAYALVAVPAQTQLQEELPSEVRGRVFGVLNMLVNIASFLPIILVGPIADRVGTEVVILGTSVLVLLAGIRSVLVAPPLAGAAFAPSRLQPTDPVTGTTSPRQREESRPSGGGEETS